MSKELTKFKDFYNRNKLIVNGNKRFVMIFNRSRTPEMVIGNSDILAVKKTLTILGVLVKDDLGWRSQVNERVKRASKTIWVNPSKRGGMDGVFRGLAGLLRGISRGRSHGKE